MRPNRPLPAARIGERPADWPRKRALWDAMRDVIDDQYSEKEANLVDLGYIYDVRTRGNDVKVIMTMPHRGRPMFEFLGKPLRARLEQRGQDGAETIVERLQVAETEMSRAKEFDHVLVSGTMEDDWRQVQAIYEQARNE